MATSSAAAPKALPCKLSMAPFTGPDSEPPIPRGAPAPPPADPSGGLDADKAARLAAPSSRRFSICSRSRAAHDGSASANPASTDAACGWNLS